MAIETLAGHVMVAKEFKNNLSNLWYAMARTTAWPDEEVPPAEDMLTNSLDDIVALKKFDSAQLVAPLSNTSGTISDSDVITYEGQDWVLISDENALTNGARYVYLNVTINPGDFPYVVYRQVGIYQGVTPAVTTNTSNILLPNQVSDYGTLIGYDNRLSQRYSNNMRILEKFVLKF